MNLYDFHRLSKKNGEPIEILDNKIAEYVSHNLLKMFILDGVPYIYNQGYYECDEDGKRLKTYIKGFIFPDLITITRINRVYNLILVDCSLTKENEEVNDYPKYWINFKNGMFDPILQELHPHDPEYFAINQIPHIFNPDAVYKGSTTEEFLNGLFPDEGDREMFLAYSGYCMTADTSLQKFMIITGLPGTGKSTAINMMIDAIGSKNVSCITLQDLNTRFAPTELLGKLLNACADLPKKALDQVDEIKKITGEDPVKGEYKGGKSFWFKSYAKLIFSANEMPINHDEKSDAFYRRMITIAVTQKGKKISGLRNGLRDGMPGFIHECVDALHRMYISGKGIDSENSKRLVHEYHRDADTVQAFLDDLVIIKPDEKAERKHLYQIYQEYCWENQWTPLGNKSFFANLRGKGFVDKPSSGQRYFVGMCTINDKSTPSSALDDKGFRQATLQENAVFMGKDGKQSI